MDTGRTPKVTRRRAPLPGQPLTTREAAVADLVAQGHRNRTIASRLGITEQTVKNHLTAIYDKMAVSSRVQLAIRQAQDGAPRPKN